MGSSVILQQNDIIEFECPNYIKKDKLGYEEGQNLIGVVKEITILIDTKSRGGSLRTFVNVDVFKLHNAEMDDDKEYVTKSFDIEELIELKYKMIRKNAKAFLIRQKYQ